MSNCKYVVNEEGGDFILEIPSISSSAGSSDLRASLLDYFSKLEINPWDILKSLKQVEKKLVVPEQIDSFILGQNSLKYVYKNFKNLELKNKFNHISSLLDTHWKNANISIKNPIYTQNIVYCAFDEQFDYEYNKKYDIIFINTVNGLNEESRTPINPTGSSGNPGGQIGKQLS